MHQHFVDNFNGLEAGIRFDVRALNAIEGGGGGSVHKPKPTKTHEVQVDGHTKTVPVTPKPKHTADDKATEAIKDGAISHDEQALIKKSSAVRDAIKGQQEKLRSKVEKSHAPLPTSDAYSGYQGRSVQSLVQTEHEQKVAELTGDKKERGLDAIDAQIKALKDAGSTSGVSALQTARKARAADEQKVADVIKDEQSLLGTYQAQKQGLTDSAPADAKDDYQVLRTKAQKWIDQFNDNDGQYYGGGMHWGDAWDTEKVDFDKLAERFHDDPSELDNFAKSQGKDDSDLRDKSLDDHLTELASDDPEEAKKVALRYEAATQLTTIMKRYNTARDTVDENADSTEELDGQISTLQDQIKTDRGALSTETLTDLDKQLESTPGIIPTDTKKTSSKELPSKQPPSDPTGKGGKAGKGDTSDPLENWHGPTKTITRTVDVDYSTKANRAKVIEQATKHNLLPGENTSFDKDGNAVYTVQPNDSYWRIADMSDGNASSFDLQHFQSAVNDNSKRLGRDPGVGMLYANDQVVIPNRNIQDLVKLLDLPKTEEVEQEVPAYMGHGNMPDPV